MTTDLKLLAYSALLTWIMLIVASALRTKTWTLQGIRLGFGNRDDLPEPSPMAARAHRAAMNMLENFVLFIAVLFVARSAGGDQARIELGAHLFFWGGWSTFRCIWPESVTCALWSGRLPWSAWRWC
jgi:uncharacterized MAPEG superfamily protein